jgi:hypothetical protein
MKKKVMKTIQISKHLGVYQMAYRSMMCGCALCSVHGSMGVLQRDCALFQSILVDAFFSLLNEKHA